MTVTHVDKDVDTPSLTVHAEFDAPVERVWQLWADPRQLERWWGPPTWPATFHTHDLRPEGEATFVMTGPEGERSRGWWRFTSVEAPTSLSFIDRFADEEGRPVPDSPTTEIDVRLESREDGGTRMRILSVYPSLEYLEKIEAMGAVEAFTQCVGQMDAVLAS
jgi:uncharacterized protein YndB with AHSA1/START domain